MSDLSSDLVPVANKEMAPRRVLAPITWLVMIMLAGNEAIDQPQQPMRLKTENGAALCANDPPMLNATMSRKVPEAPEPVRCAMTCTSVGGCKHFNYVSTMSKPCQLYDRRPTDFGVVPNCKHYGQPGR